MNESESKAVDVGNFLASSLAGTLDEDVKDRFADAVLNRARLPENREAVREVLKHIQKPQPRTVDIVEPVGSGLYKTWLNEMRTFRQFHITREQYDDYFWKDRQPEGGPSINVGSSL